MAISDILLAPAENEGFGRSIIEAMISKVPVVAAESGGHVEIIKNNINGLLCPPNSSLSFVDAILKLLNDKIFYNNIVKKEAAIFAKVGFDPTDHASQVAKVYKFLPHSVAIVIESMGGGGTQQIVKTLNSHWTKKSVNQTLITLKDQSFDEVQLDNEIDRISIQKLLPSSNIFHAIKNNIRRVLYIRKAINQSDARVVVSFLTTTNILVLISSIGLGKKIIISERNDPYKQPLNLPWRLLRRWFYPSANVLICNSQAAVDFFKEKQVVKRSY